jgi:hypothetical protein
MPIIESQSRKSDENFRISKAGQHGNGTQGEGNGKARKGILAPNFKDVTNNLINSDKSAQIRTRNSSLQNKVTITIKIYIAFISLKSTPKQKNT